VGTVSHHARVEGSGGRPSRPLGLGSGAYKPLNDLEQGLVIGWTCPWGLALPEMWLGW
jgi:hypothetical protein